MGKHLFATQFIFVFFVYSSVGASLLACFIDIIEKSNE